jgi:pantoate--beta-alanine ligase
MTNESPIVARSVAAMRKEVEEWRRTGDVVGVVPTMGALHDGHLALVQAAKSECDRVIATIFVNPAQFAANEDLDAYPRGEAADLAKLRELKTDLAFMPDAGEMYPNGFVTKVGVEGITEILCGLGRPVHFGGVATVVSKLFNQSQADRAYFGEKDYQQFLVVRRMARDLDIPIEVVSVPTVREADGLAMSSRNVYLSDGQRAKAPALYRVIRDVAARVANGTSTAVAIAWGYKELETCGFDRIEYLEVLEAEMLGPIDFPRKPARVFVAAYLSSIRLIDNVAV